MFVNYRTPMRLNLGMGGLDILTTKTCSATASTTFFILMVEKLIFTANTKTPALPD